LVNHSAPKNGESPAPMRFLKINSRLRPVLVLAIAIFAFYGCTLFSSFHFDDRSSILENPALKSRAGILKNLWEYWPTRFITTVSFFINYRIGEKDPFGYHLADIIIHTINSVLVYFLLLNSFRVRDPSLSKPKIFAAALGAFFFALHPLQTQAVSYIAQRATSLAATCYLMSLLLYILGRRKNSFPWYFFSWVTGCFALFSKELAVTLPLAIVLWDLIFFRRGRKSRWPRLMAFSLLLLIIPAIVFFNSENPKYNDSGQIDFWAGDQNYAPVLGGIIAPQRGEYALTQIRVLTTYLRLVAFPFRQNLDYDYPLFFFFLQYRIVLSSLIILALIISSCLLLKKEKRMGAFGIMFFFLALLPESSLIPIRDVIFEHRLYLPLAGTAFLIAEILPTVRRWKIPAGAMLLLLALLTFNRNRIWRDELSLWVDTVSKSPDKARPLNNLGYIYNREGLYRPALRVLSRANEIEGDYPEALLNLAITYRHLDRLEEAEAACLMALRLKPEYPEAFNCRGDILRLQGKSGEAEKAYLSALELNPRFSEARNNLANLYQEMGKGELARRQYQKALLGGEENPTYLNNLGLHYLKEGELEAAVKTFRRALALDGSLYQAYYNLGNALVQKSDLPAALLSYQRAVKLKPDYARAYYNLGTVYSRRGEWDEALKSFLKVVELEPDSVQAHLKAGLIYALYLKQPEPAVKHLRQALALDPELPEKEQIEKLLNTLVR